MIINISYICKTLTEQFSLWIQPKYKKNYKNTNPYEPMQIPSPVRDRQGVNVNFKQNKRRTQCIRTIAVYHSMVYPPNTIKHIM